MTHKNNNSNYTVDDLVEVMARLRNPNAGCPWDLEQNFETIAPYTIEEAYEVADAIQKNDMDALKDELGDLLFQVVFHARLAEEQASFTFDDVVSAIGDKLTRRHPHVFEEGFSDKRDLAEQWESHKRKEKASNSLSGILGDVRTNQPAINHAYKLQKKAASVGFDWDSIKPVLDKLDEEMAEFKEEINIDDNYQRIEEELGDVLFSCINLARHLNVNPEWSLRKANMRFTTRFAFIEQELIKSNLNIEDCSLETLDALWGKAKTKEL